MRARGYLDTAALSESARFDGEAPELRLTSVLQELVPLRRKAGWEVVFGSNSTQVLKAVVEGLLAGSRLSGHRTSLIIDERLHPVFVSCAGFVGRCQGLAAASGLLTPSRIRISKRGTRGTGRMIVIVPVTCWRTGAVLNGAADLLAIRSAYPGSLVIADAVQCLGNIPRNLVSEVLNVEAADVVVGGIHKWLGCSRPLGVAWVRRDLLAKHKGFREWLALNDFLGASAGPRRAMRCFPDTYDGRAALDLARELRSRFPDVPGINRHYQILRQNTSFLRYEFRKLEGCALLNPCDEPERLTAIVSISGRKSILCAVSRAMDRAGFVHTFIPRARGREAVRCPILRVSAPTQPLTRADQDVIRSLLSPFQQCHSVLKCRGEAGATHRQLNKARS
jgi:selenocysteine lyase/cysteine desulfurase